MLVKRVALNFTQRQARKLDGKMHPESDSGVLHQPELLRTGQIKQSLFLRFITFFLI